MSRSACALRAGSRGAAVAGGSAAGAGALLAVHPDGAPASALAPLLRRDGKPGFVVTDMDDVDLFAPLDTVALPALTAGARAPQLLTEGIHWVLQQPAVLERNHCFMTTGSRLRKPGGALDARTPAIWISNGTGRGGRERRDAPELGWCWAGNRHTRLGFTSAAGRRGQDL
ncbi:DUF5701 family protein [Streptomyces puniciscabiei]